MSSARIDEDPQLHDLHDVGGLALEVAVDVRPADAGADGGDVDQRSARCHAASAPPRRRRRTRFPARTGHARGVGSRPPGACRAAPAMPRHDRDAHDEAERQVLDHEAPPHEAGQLPSDSAAVRAKKFTSSARPSLSPDSRLSNGDHRGCRGFVTTLEEDRIGGRRQRCRPGMTPVHDSPVEQLRTTATISAVSGIASAACETARPPVRLQQLFVHLQPVAEQDHDRRHSGHFGHEQRPQVEVQYGDPITEVDPTITNTAASRTNVRPARPEQEPRQRRDRGRGRTPRTGRHHAHHHRHLDVYCGHDG